MNINDVDHHRPSHHNTTTVIVAFNEGVDSVLRRVRVIRLPQRQCFRLHTKMGTVVLLFLSLLLLVVVVTLV